MENAEKITANQPSVPQYQVSANVGKRRVRLLWLMLGCIAALLLTGCGMNTEMKLDGQFKGERVITCDELEDQNNLLAKF